MLPLLLSAISCLVLYFIIRKAVMHGILDADDARTSRDRRKRFEELVRNGTLPDAPKS